MNTTENIDFESFFEKIKQEHPNGFISPYPKDMVEKIEYLETLESAGLLKHVTFSIGDWGQAYAFYWGDLTQKEAQKLCDEYYDNHLSLFGYWVPKKGPVDI